jgi:hypothetical protein
MARPIISAEHARSLFSYAPETGVIVRKNGLGNASAGYVQKNGYRYINIRGVGLLRAHRLAWLLFYGEWPALFVDHINGDRADNRLENLRLVTPTHSAQNKRRATSTSLTGLLGVATDKARGRFMARITVDGVRKFIGAYKTPEEAHAAYVEAKRRLHPACTI